TPDEMRRLADWFAALAERPLREQNRRLGALLDALPDRLVLQDGEGRLVYTNRAAAGLPLMADREELYGRARRGESTTIEVLLPGAEGAGWYEQHITPVFDADGAVEAMAIASRDIHDRKAAEARLQLLSKIGTLAETSEYESVVSAVARLSIPELADW